MRTRGENEVRAFFRSAGLDKEIHRFDESTHNSELAARSLGVEVGQVAKTILLLNYAKRTGVMEASFHQSRAA